MNDVAAVRVRDRLAHLDEDGEQLVELERSPRGRGNGGRVVLGAGRRPRAPDALRAFPATRRLARPARAPPRSRRAAPREDRLERLAVDEAHGNEVLARDAAPGVVDRRDPGVVEARRDSGLAQEARDSRRARVAADHLERRSPPEPPVEHEVDDAHAALAQDPLAREEQLGRGSEERVALEDSPEVAGDGGLGRLAGHGRARAGVRGRRRRRGRGERHGRGRRERSGGQVLPGRPARRGAHGRRRRRSTRGHLGRARDGRRALRLGGRDGGKLDGRALACRDRGRRRQRRGQPLARRQRTRQALARRRLRGEALAGGQRSDALAGRATREPRQTVGPRQARDDEQLLERARVALLASQ